LSENVNKDVDGRIRDPVSKVMVHIIPLIALLYFISFLDRVNIGFAALTMNRDLGLSGTAYGAAAGIFFLGYCIFEVPSNMILDRVGARRWISIIMVVWGGLSVAMAFVTGFQSFSVVRFLLGAAEAGFFPGIILYLTYWFPTPIRGRILGWFMVALPLSSAIGAPFSTWLLGIHLLGLRGWQSMFISEGLPAIVFGLLTLCWLPDRPANAKWLTRDEVREVEAALAEEAIGKSHTRLWDGLASLIVWRFAIIYFGILIGLYGFGFWAPQMIKAFGGLTNQQVGLITTIPYLLAAIVMFVWARHSDRKGERRWHVALPAMIGAAGFGVSCLTSDPIYKVAAFTFVAIGIYAALPVFWTMPTASLTGAAAAGGIALINAIGNLGGYIGPTVIGQLKDRFGYNAGLLVLAAAMSIAGLLVLTFPKADALRTEAIELG